MVSPIRQVRTGHCEVMKMRFYLPLTVFKLLEKQIRRGFQADSKNTGEIFFCSLCDLID